MKAYYLACLILRDAFLAEESVPDISNWTSQQISAFFAERGFPPEVCRKFTDLVTKHYLFSQMLWNQL